MGNCLKTQLKAEVNNDNLPIFDVVKLRANYIDGAGEAQSVLGISCSSPVTIECDGEGLMGSTYATIETERLKSVNVTNDENVHYIYFSNGNYNVYIKGKKSLTALTLELLANSSDTVLSLNINDLQYAPLIFVNINASKKCSGSIDCLHSTLTLNNLNVTGSVVAGDIANLPSSMERINLPYNNNIVNKLSDAGKFANLSRFYSNTATEDVLDFVTSQIAAGRTTLTGNNLDFAYLSSFKFNGINVPDAYRGWLTWENANKIAWINREGTKVVCYGYTQSEAETNWPGKTIVRVDA